MEKGVFPTELPKYISPYSASAVSKSPKASSKKSRFPESYREGPADPMVSNIVSLYEQKYHQTKPIEKNTEVRFALEVLNLPEIREIMIAVLSSK
jgi:hypothetical protein